MEDKNALLKGVEKAIFCEIPGFLPMAGERPRVRHCELVDVQNEVKMPPCSWRRN